MEKEPRVIFDTAIRGSVAFCEDGLISVTDTEVDNTECAFLTKLQARELAAALTRWADE